MAKYKGTPLESDYEALQRRRAITKALLGQAVSPYEQQMVSGYAVPAWGEAIGKIAQGYAAGKFGKQADEEEQALSDLFDEEVAARRQKVIDQLQGSDVTTSEYGPIQPVAGDPQGAALTAGADPYLGKNEGFMSVLDAMIKAEAVKKGRGSRSRPIGTQRGYLQEDEHGNWVPLTDKSGEPYKPWRSDPSTVYNLKYLSTEAGHDADLIGKPPVAAAVVAAETGVGGDPLTPAQKAVDTEFAKEYVDYRAKGGYADIEKGLTQLRGVADTIIEGDYTGPTMPLRPDIVQRFTDPEAIAARSTVEEVVQRNLRLILGAQFTQKEGERLIARAYDEGLPPEENQRRLLRLIKSMEDAARAKQDASNYYEQNGTLRGWDGKLYSIYDFTTALEPEPEKGEDTTGSGYEDADKERRYQEWKAKRKSKQR